MARQDDLDATINEAKEKLRGSFRDADAMRLLGSCYMYLKMRDEALFMYEKALAAAPDSPTAKFALASFFVNDNQRGKAVSMLRDINSGHPGFAPAFELLGKMLSEDCDAAGALEAMKKAADIESDNPEILYELGNLYDDNDMADLAMRMYEKAVEIDPEHAPALNAIGMLHTDNEDWDAAIASFRRALAAVPGYSNAHLNLANACKNHPAMPFQDVVDELNLAIRFDPENADALNALGEIYYEDEDYRRALDCFNNAADVNPELPDTFLNLGNVYYMLGEANEAVSAWRRASDLDPENADPHFWIARACLEAGQELEAAIRFKLYLSIEPDGDNAQEASAALDKMKYEWPV
jgi:tetratricopeptide (TPR) repeat protein